MASIRERIGRLEGKIAPPVPPNPWLGLLLKTMDHTRAELDGEEPGPLVLTPEEKRLDLEASEDFLAYLDDQRQLPLSPETRAELDGWEIETRAEIAKLREEIETEGAS